MKNIVSFLITCGFIYYTQAQTASITQIEEEYAFVLGKIERADYFVNEFKVNANRNKKHFDEDFQYSERYHYQFDPRSDSSHRLVLKAVVILSERFGEQRYEQFVYDNEGNLIVYYEERKKPGEAPHERKKAIIQQKKVVVWHNNEKDKSEDEYKGEGYLLMRSTKLQENFREQMQNLD